MAEQKQLRTTLTLRQQAEFLEEICNRCVMSNGEVAGEALLVLQPCDFDELKALSARLRRISPFEQKIRNMVTGQ